MLRSPCLNSYKRTHALGNQSHRLQEDREEEQAVGGPEDEVGKTTDYLRGWFKSLRNNYARLEKEKWRCDREGVMGEVRESFKPSSWDSCTTFAS